MAFRGHDVLAVTEAFDALPRPPWGADWMCTGCGHRRDQHAEDLVNDGRCLRVIDCTCPGWDPFTVEQWQTVLAAERAGMLR